jgi:hypothetical protein
LSCPDARLIARMMARMMGRMMGRCRSAMPVRSRSQTRSRTDSGGMLVRLSEATCLQHAIAPFDGFTAEIPAVALAAVAATLAA